MLIPSKHLLVLKTSLRRLQHVFSVTVFRLPRCLEDVLEDEKLLRWRRVEDVLKTGQARNQEFFRAGEFSRNQGTSIKISSTTHERKAPQGKNMGFLLETLETTFKMRNLTQDGHNQGTFFPFLKKSRGDLPPSPALVARLQVLKMSSRHVFKTSWRYVFKTSSRRLGDKKNGDICI